MDSYWRDGLSPEEEAVVSGIEEAVRSGMTGFAACVVAQLAGLDEAAAEHGLFTLSSRRSTLLEREVEGRCPNCGSHLRSRAANDPLRCHGCGEPGLPAPRAVDLQHFYVPRGELAEKTPRLLASVPLGPRLRASALATKAMGQRLASTV